jgi:hypothetical protein
MKLCQRGAFARGIACGKPCALGSIWCAEHQAEYLAKRKRRCDAAIKRLAENPREYLRLRED